MYRIVDAPRFGMGFSLKPPKWIRDPLAQLGIHITTGNASATPPPSAGASQVPQPTPTGQTTTPETPADTSWMLPAVLGGGLLLFLLMKRGRKAA